MPEYKFACDCGHRQSVIWSMNKSKNILCCPECGNSMYREYNFSVGGGTYSKPIVSDSLAISPEQIPEHRKHFPDVEVTPEGQPVFDNFKKHEDYLQKTGFVKERQKLKPKGKRIGKTKKV